MKLIFHGIDGAFDVNTPSDAHFLNCLYAMETEAPRCAGVKSGEARLIPVTVDIEAPDKGLRGNVTFERIECPASCPRDQQSIKDRCLIGYQETSGRPH